MTQTNTLYQGQFLAKNAPHNFILSNNGQYKLILQDDGNLVLYRLTADKGHPIFASMTNGNKKIEKAIFQDDGNFVVYENGESHAAWASQTHKMGAVRLTLEDSGVIVLYNKQNKPINYINKQSWMASLDGNLTLKQICMPGSHDAGMYRTNYSFKPGLALCHGASIFEQLNNGVRYFDLRPEKTRTFLGIGSKINYDAYHGPATGPSFDEEILKDIADFLKNGSQETIIIGLTHFKDFTNEYKTEFFRIIKNKLSNYLFTTQPADTSKIYNLPLSKLRGKVIILMDLTNDSKKDEYEEVVPHELKQYFYKSGFAANIFDVYSNKLQYNDMFYDQLEKFNQFRDHDRLFLLNWTFTAPKNIDSVVLTNREMAEYINPKLTDYGEARKYLFVPNPFGYIVNIINGDYWDLHDYKSKVMLACCEVMNNRS